MNVPVTVLWDSIHHNTATGSQHCSVQWCARGVPAGPQQYLVVGRVLEQLSKARRHLAELVALALHANRTLVLPHCGASRVGPASDFHLPLCTYFDVRSLPPALRWVSEELFYGQVVPGLEKEHSGLGFSAVLLMAGPKMPCSFVSALRLVTVLTMTVLTMTLLKIMGK